MQRGFAVPLITDFTLLITPHLRNDLQTLKAWGGGGGWGVCIFLLLFLCSLESFYAPTILACGYSCKGAAAKLKTQKTEFCTEQLPHGSRCNGVQGKMALKFHRAV